MPTSRSTTSMNRFAASGSWPGSRVSLSTLPHPSSVVVDRLHVAEQIGAVGVVVEQFAVESVAGADLDRVEPVEDVELGQRELAEAVEADRLAQHHAVEPAGPAATTGDGAVLPADVDEAFPVVVEQFGRERPGADPRGVGLGDPDDAIDVARPDTRARRRRRRRWGSTT